MQTIVIVLDACKLEYPDPNIRFILPQKAERFTRGRVVRNDFEFLNDAELAIRLGAENAAEDVKLIIEMLKTEKFCGNDLSQTAEIYISEKEFVLPEYCTKIYPE